MIKDNVLSFLRKQESVFKNIVVVKWIPASVGIAMFLGCLSILLNACSDEQSTTKTVYGKLANSNGEKVSLEELTPQGPQLIDTATVDAEGNFTFTKPINRVGFYQVFISEQNFATVVLDSAQQLEVTGDARDLGNTHRVKGAKDAELFWHLNENSKENYRKRDSLTRAFQTYLNDKKPTQKQIDSLSTLMETEYNVLVENQNKYLLDFLVSNPQSITVIAAAQQLSADDHFEQFEKVFVELKEKYPSSLYVKLFEETITAASKLRVGSQAPEISMNDENGNPFPLSSLKGKVVLIDFWASWCGPCRATNPQLVSIYEKYKKNNFEIYAVSLDKDKEKWLEAIAKDGLTWKHVSDLKFWSSPVVKLYNFNGIPYNVLLDKEGKIVAKNLHDKDLDNKIKESIGM